MRQNEGEYEKEVQGEIKIKINRRYFFLCNKTNLMKYLSSVYFVNQPVHVSGIFVAHHQDVYCIYTSVGTCCAFQLTVCWPGWDGTDVSRYTVKKTQKKIFFSKKKEFLYYLSNV